MRAKAQRSAGAAKPTRVDNSHTRLRRELLTKPGQWAVLRTSVHLNQAAAHRLARAYTHAKPARLDPDATGTFHARAFQHHDSWHVAVTYQPSESVTYQPSESEDEN